MSKALLIAGGILNAVFFLFHLLLGYQIQHLAVRPELRGLMQALNVSGILFIFFFAYVSFFHRKELLGTGVGRIVLALVSALYLSRSAQEFFLFKFSPMIFISCVVVGIIYLALLILSAKRPVTILAGNAAAA